MSLPGFLTRNWIFKLSAFGIALLLWVAVRVEAPDTQVLEGVPVRVDLMDPGWALAADPTPSGITVRFRGPSRELLRMMVDRPSVVIPLDQVASPDTSVVLQRHWIRLQDRPGVTVEEIQPTTVRLALETIRRVELPPAPRLGGELPEGLALTARPAVMPAELRVFGPESRVAALDSVPLQSLDLSGIRASGVHTVLVDTTSLRGVQVQPSQVEVEIRVADRVERLVSGVPVTLDFDGWEAIYEVSPGEGTVRLEGARDRIEAVSATALRIVPAEDADDLPPEPGEEVTVALRVAGVPEFVVGIPEPAEVTVRRREVPDEGDPPAQEPSGQEPPAQGLPEERR